LIKVINFIPNSVLRRDHMYIRTDLLRPHVLNEEGSLCRECGLNRSVRMYM